MQSSRQASLKAPFPWFGGKSKVADIIWREFGDVKHYVEPFFGSGAALLGRPTKPHVETVNDKDGFVCNAWRAIKYAPEETAQHADWPTNENDLHARHAWLTVRRAELTARLEGDPDYYDAKIAGWWLWGMACWIGCGFCSGNGPWHVVGGKLVNDKGNADQGVKRQSVHLGNADQGVNRKLAHLGDAGRGVNRQRGGLHEWFGALSDRLSRVRVACGDWERICGDWIPATGSPVGVFLDPPYDLGLRDGRCYAEDEQGISARVREWALSRGDDARYRIALCGYEGEHAMPDNWRCVAWKAKGGYGSQGEGRGRENAAKERIWLSPHCLGTNEQMRLL